MVRNHNIAVNPIDYSDAGQVPLLSFPFVLASDVAAEVIALGAGVTRFKPGARVVAHAAGADTSNSKPGRLPALCRPIRQQSYSTTW